MRYLEIRIGDCRVPDSVEHDRDECPDDLHHDEHRNAAGLMPANVSVSVRAMVTAGLAKLVDDVNQYAAAM